MSEQTISATISYAAYIIVGWDDAARTPGLQRTFLSRRRGVVLTGSRETMRYAADVLSDYADPNDMGDFEANGVTASQRRSAKLAEQAVRAAIAEAGTQSEPADEDEPDPFAEGLDDSEAAFERHRELDPHCTCTACMEWHDAHLTDE